MRPILSPMEISREIFSCGWQGVLSARARPTAARTPGRKSPARSRNGVETRSSGGCPLAVLFFFLASPHRDLVTATPVVSRRNLVHNGLGGPNRTFFWLASQTSLPLDPSRTPKTCRHPPSRLQRRPGPGPATRLPSRLPSERLYTRQFPPFSSRRLPTIPNCHGSSEIASGRHRGRAPTPARAPGANEPPSHGVP